MQSPHFGLGRQREESRVIFSFTIIFVMCMGIHKCIIVKFNMKHLEENQKENWREKKKREGEETKKRRAGRN